MTSYTLADTELNALAGKTILIIGAATGVGRAAVEIAAELGANVAIGDWNEDEGTALAKTLGDRIIFRKCDVSNWDHVLDLFEAAHARFGVIHSVLSNAGINTHEGLFTDTMDPSTGRLLPPSLKSIDVNLVGQLYVAKCALHYFAKWPQTRCQLVMTSSAGAFFPAPPIHIYCAAKAGIVGLMRALYPELEGTNVTVNTVAPWLTVTPMLLEDWLQKWTLPKNTAAGVAKALFLPIVRPEMNGKSFFVAGNQLTELEDSLHDAEPAWMGQELCHQVRQGQAILLGKN
ncbi:hypothetical protein N0V84_006751 [Fusarium piperis]|uniref:Uncharacterized protein n=1 Tax=Fusarium piperis TaxID=1435070 RepID=A0A9W8WBA5_9HYPO|nr:hypothetical protein N0V84_006751 [Fusarium piperis]